MFSVRSDTVRCRSCGTLCYVTESKITCLPAIAARLGGYGRERLHAYLPLLPDYVVTGENDCMPACPYCPIRWSRERKIACLPALTARLGGHGREIFVCRACPYCPIRWSRERKIACLPALTA